YTTIVRDDGFLQLNAEDLNEGITMTVWIEHRPILPSDNGEAGDRFDEILKNIKAEKGDFGINKNNNDNDTQKFDNYFNNSINNNKRIAPEDGFDVSRRSSPKKQGGIKDLINQENQQSERENDKDKGLKTESISKSSS